MKEDMKKFDLSEFQISESEQKEVEERWRQHKEKIRQRKIKNFHNLAKRMTALKEMDLASMSYRKFLRTPYWKTVREYVKVMAGKCEQCGTEHGYLEVHHKSYTWRGAEWRHLKDLMAVCRRCHERITFR